MTKSILHVADILEWAKAFHERHGRWPKANDGSVIGQPDETWCGIDQALRKGRRGQGAGSSLARLLQKHFGVRNKQALPKYTLSKILKWTDAHRKRTNRWPSCWDGPIFGIPDETWLAVDKALRYGLRGFPGGSSLAQLLELRRGVRNPQRLPRFKAKQILAWADAYYAGTGVWPTRDSGPIEPKSTENWLTVSHALETGARGMPKCGSLAQFLAKHRGVRNRKALSKLSVSQILKWADEHYERTGQWPRHVSGPIPESGGETWHGVHSALYTGYRGFPGGDSLYKLLVRNGRRR